MTVYEMERILQPNADVVHSSSVTLEEKSSTSDTNNHYDAHQVLDVIFDAAYSISCLKAWGTPSF